MVEWAEEKCIPGKRKLTLKIWVENKNRVLLRNRLNFSLAGVHGLVLHAKKVDFIFKGLGSHQIFLSR